MTYQINKAVVIGAGTMGAAIAAHLANVGVEVTLLDIVPRELTPEEKSKGLTLESPQVRNRIVKNGFDAVLKSRPASFYDKKFTTWVSLGNLEDDFDAVAEADWIIEAIIENLKIKQNLMERIDGVRKPKSIVSTNTSGIPVTSIADGRSEGFRQHFLGTHFFNPPRYLKLLEVIPTDATFPEVVDTISWFSEYRLGKGVVLCKDTPNFIGNRITFGTAVYAMDYILKNGYTVEEVDAVTGPPIGHPKTATFRLIDLVGIDVWHHVGENLKDAIPDDKMAQDYLDSEPASRVFDTMLEKGWLGNKTKVGFYKQVRVEGKKEFWPLNLETLEHEAPQKVRFDSVGEAKDKETLGEKMMVFMEGEDRAAELVRALTLQSFA
ncbi:MAG: 3-hydroxyacyl-CoA dehydrogenase/enoyl-CoA hydratase family protein, partial [candidate division Zixibacteria bacterium]|nr:3-hydroxyacyl-CoA dehydrogenase family protein [candidate division Zixibacteria bacterium]NIS48773.1 3-hydroxyacyl-CoA dehydrogenase family protein [candidate division Zixibacteria bacterium]NIU16838.1 3-hydroxyacyl-CoA dehydrogenase family protein [candidate division Zixibacteria bacterium]NIV09006.1 3-hydroxyacyl-CoA dehydrogenase/enoyl-CoA hydratase family protein [candidate division Zixibacteria bacterium]NIW49875.1 3-hydroxyacyl-CoA dehydrogenase/enoyl-CoA hydratase family protein [Gamm